MSQYTKPALTNADLIALLTSRGLTIEDKARADRYLNTIGYYRLSAYFAPFFETKDVFITGTTFNNILSLYIFDRKLRLVTLDPIQRIEIALRANISNYMSITYSDPFWFLNSSLFLDINEHNSFLQLCRIQINSTKKNLSQACNHYYNKYGIPNLPPSWVLIEELSMGVWSKIFENIKSNQDKRKIAARFNFMWHDFISWIHFLTFIRNSLAHHRRFWNQNFPFMPSNIKNYVNINANQKQPYINFVIIMTFLKQFVNSSSWGDKLHAVLDTCPIDYNAMMHFPKNWEQLPPWN